MIRVCLIGIGKTGREIAKVLMEQKDIELVAAVCSPGSAKKGKDLGEVIGSRNTGVTIQSSENLKELIFKDKPDVVVDFSSPEATIRNSKIFSEMKVNLVICTTGFSKIDLMRLFVMTRKYHNAIAYAPNITLGVNVLMLMANLAASILNNYDFQITEIHHNKKKDSPSGTALKISKEIERGYCSAGKGSKDLEVKINSIRAGGVIGKHQVLIAGEEDQIEIYHESYSRKAFAHGVIQAVRFIYKKSGYYEMNDILNLTKVLSDYVERENRKRKKWLNNYIDKAKDAPESMA